MATHKRQAPSAGAAPSDEVDRDKADASREQQLGLRPEIAPKIKRSATVNAAARKDDQREIERTLGLQTELALDNPTEDDLAQIEEVLSDLDRFEGGAFKFIGCD